MKGYTAFPKAPELLEPHHQIFRVISRTLIGKFYPSAEKESVYSTARFNWASILWGCVDHIFPLNPCCILSVLRRTVCDLLASNKSPPESLLFSIFCIIGCTSWIYSCWRRFFSGFIFGSSSSFLLPSILLLLLLLLLFTPLEFLTSVLADGFSLEFEWQQVSSRTLLSILAVLCNAVIWIVSNHPPTSKSSRSFNNPLVIVPKAPITIGTIVTFMFQSFFNSLARSRYLSFF